MDEKRLHPRVGFAKEVWIGQDGIFSRTDERMTNISIGGAFIETVQSYAIGTLFDLRFKLDSSNEFISCSVIVRNRREGQGLGVQFLDLSPEYFQQLKSHIEQKLAELNAA